MHQNQVSCHGANNKEINAKGTGVGCNIAINLDQPFG